MWLPPNSAGSSRRRPILLSATSKALYEHVQAKGANIVMELEEQPYSGSLFAVRDPEGQLWSIGSYDPWVEE